MRTTTTVKRRVGTVAAVAAAGVLLIAGPASAHVTVQPPTAVKGASDQTFSFRVPNEKDNASTTEVQVYFPSAEPIASVLVAPTPGWKASITSVKLATPIQTDDGAITDAVSSITWTGGSIAPGYYQDFTVDMGQLPSNTDALTFKALQTYSDGSIVRWIQNEVPGQPEPANPAPVLTLTDAAAPAGSSSAGAKAAATAAAPSGSGSDTLARVLGGIGVVIGLLGVGFGYLGWRRGGSSGSGRGTGGSSAGA
ncbi:YcnI family protein [Streptacidiphilus sp. PB12-B1b]|uniref:YcnI family copper-binding membrane protein n=1 Tax=Streptacidiphilus sp. PB12-B1b TaxID=2705012 RepID=UPI0015FAF249|nr:YcnI family protein [Streptacidiphilus sp. PB12-B1b]QMU74506.1 YcnI family protein [Streptacidiphilus sp. PB12-B1b]